MILNFEERRPIISEESFVAKNAAMIGEVTIGKNSSIWYNVVLRGTMIQLA
jgi:carbonic anhydrase/acetyltransferase-like protein (isoleucine patch superfamily)